MTIRRHVEKLFVRIPDAYAADFRTSIVSENLTRLVIGGAVLSAVELGVFISSIRMQPAIHFFPVAAILFNAAMIPLLILLGRRHGRTRLKRALVYLSVLFYLFWACIFTWSNRALTPEVGMNILFSPYLLMVYGIAIVVYLEPAWSAVLFLLSFGLFAGMMPLDVLSPREAAINIWNALALNMFAWLASRLIFAFRLRTFIDNWLILERNAALETERENLVDALASVKQLSGLLPICSNCKKVRDDNGYWQLVEQYISERSDATFSHGLCPDCMKKMYPDEESS